MAQIVGNHHGTVLEQQVCALLVSKGYTQVVSDVFDTAQTPVFVRQYRRFKTLYGAKMRLDVLLKHPQRWPESLAIECKWQQSVGSVDEKFPYVVENMKALPIPAAVLLAGGGYSKRAAEWLLSQETERLTIVEGLDAIIRWGHAQL